MPVSDDKEISKLPVTSSAVEIVAYAAQQSYWKHAETTTVRSAVTYAGEETLTYPFNTITINKVIRYTAESFDVPDKSDTKNISENVKQFKGIEELFVTDFVTDITGGNTLLTLKYENGGEYSCIINGGSSYNGIEEIEFSSHIQLTETAIEKDPTFPIYLFFINSGQNEYKFGYIYRLSENNPGASEPEVWFSLDDKNEVIANDVYDIKDIITG
jgi:hypothetical protein